MKIRKEKGGDEERYRELRRGEKVKCREGRDRESRDSGEKSGKEQERRKS